MRDQVKHEQQTRADCEAKLNTFKRLLEKDTGKPVLPSSLAHSEIQSALSMIQAAMTGGEETEGFQVSVLLEKHISDLVATATESRERLVKQAEVQSSFNFDISEDILISVSPIYAFNRRW